MRLPGLAFLGAICLSTSAIAETEPQRLGIADVIRAVKAELVAAQKASEEAGEEALFVTKEFELELSFTVSQKGGGEAGVRFWVIQAGVSGETATSDVQRIKLKFDTGINAEKWREAQMAKKHLEAALKADGGADTLQWSAAQWADLCDTSDCNLFSGNLPPGSEQIATPNLFLKPYDPSSLPPGAIMDRSEGFSLQDLDPATLRAVQDLILQHPDYFHLKDYFAQQLSASEIDALQSQKFPQQTETLRWTGQ